MTTRQRRIGKEEMQGSGIGQRIRRRLTYANVMATIAVFLCLGGASAVAAGALGKNTVGPRQLKARSVTTGKLANNAVNANRTTRGLPNTDMPTPDAMRSNAATNERTSAGPSGSGPRTGRWWARAGGSGTSRRCRCAGPRPDSPAPGP